MDWRRLGWAQGQDTDTLIKKLGCVMGWEAQRMRYLKGKLSIFCSVKMSGDVVGKRSHGDQEAGIGST